MASSVAQKPLCGAAWIVLALRFKALSDTTRAQVARGKTRDYHGTPRRNLRLATQTSGAGLPRQHPSCAPARYLHQGHRRVLPRRASALRTLLGSITSIGPCHPATPTGWRTRASAAYPSTKCTRRCAVTTRSLGRDRARSPRGLSCTAESGQQQGPRIPYDCSTKGCVWQKLRVMG